jgi:recombination protein RecA
MAKDKKSFDAQMQALFDEDMYEKTFIELDNPYEQVTFIKSGSFSLDASLGGGIPKRRFSIIEGLPAGGKTSLAFSIAKNEILINKGRVLYVEIENQQGIDYAGVLLGHPEWIGKEFVFTKPDTSDNAFHIVEAGISSGEFGLIVLDSVAALAPEEEKEKKFEEGNMAIIPRDLAKFFRRNVFGVRTNNVAVLFINQLRSKIGAYVPTFTAPGGLALEYYSSVIIRLNKASDIKVGEETVGIMTKFVTKKNKLAPPFRSFLIPIMFGKGIDTGRDMVSFAESMGIIKRAGAYYKFEGETLGKGMNATIDFLENSPQTLDKITDMCYNLLGTLKPADEDSIE